MTPKFTPGPWWHENEGGWSIWKIRSQPGEILAEVIGDSAETDANARLIAKSPAMYKELRRLQEVVGEEDALLIEQLLSEIDGED